MKRIIWPNDMSFEITVMIAIEYDVSYLCRTYWIVGYDQDDLAQELRFHVWRKLPKYNPLKSKFRTFAKRVMTNRIRDLVRASHRQKREIVHNLTSLDNLPDEVSNS